MPTTSTSTSNSSDASAHTATDDDNDSIALFDISRASRDPLPIRSDDRYEILGEHARGGLGRILLARDREVGRVVAIKELLRNRRRGEARFVREAIVTAHLDHPSIVPVYEVGRWPSGEPFYSMKLVSGRPLKELIGDAATIDERLALIPNILAIADAAAYAHSRGIIHRDLKPPNIIVGDFGETIVIDWGLAKNIGEDDSTLDSNDSADDEDSWDQSPRDTHPNLTRQGAVLGTASYMAPEQARGDDVDERADVYAIGAILYHALSGSAPFSGTTSQETIDSVIAGPPRGLSKVAPSVPKDLGAIVGKAMERKRNDRYDDAQQLAEDLRRYQEGQLVAARVYSRSQLFHRWLVRNRFALAFVATLAIAGTAATLGIRSQRDDAIAAKEEAVSAKEATDHSNMVVTAEREAAIARTNQLILAQATAKLDSDPMTSLALLKHYPEGEPNWDRAAEIASVAVAKGVVRRAINGHNGIVFRISVDSSGERLLTRSAYGEIRLADLTNGRVTSIGTAQHTSGDALLTGDGQWAFWYDDRGAFAKRTDGGVTRVLTKLVVTHAALSPRGDTIVFGTATGKLLEWSSVTNTTRTLASQNSAIHLVAFSNVGDWIATANTARTISQYHRTKTRSGFKTEHLALGLTYADDDGNLLVADITNSLTRYNVEVSGWAEVDSIHHGKRALTSTNIGSLTWSRTEILDRADGSIVAQLNESVHAWTSEGNVTLNIPTVGNSIGRIAVSEVTGAIAITEIEGARLITLGGAEYPIRIGQRAAMFATTFHPQTGQLFLASASGSIYEWTPPVRDVVSRRPGIRTLHGAVASDADGSLYAGGANGEIWHWDRDGNSRLLGRANSYISGLAWLPISKELIVGSGSGEIIRFDLELQPSTVTQIDGEIEKMVVLVDGSALVRLEDGNVTLVPKAAGKAIVNAQIGDRIIHEIATSNEHAILLAADGAVIKLETDGPEVLLLEGEPGAPVSNRLATTSSGRLLAVGRTDGLLTILDVQTAKVRLQFQLGGAIFEAAFSPDERWLSVVLIGQTSYLIDLDSGQTQKYLELDASCRGTAISPDSTFSAVAYFGGTVVVRKLATGRTTVLQTSSEAGLIGFTADSKSVILANEKGLLLWHFDEAEMPPESPREIKAWLNEQTAIEMSAEDLGIAVREPTVAN